MELPFVFWESRKAEASLDTLPTFEKVRAHMHPNSCALSASSVRIPLSDEMAAMEFTGPVLRQSFASRVAAETLLEFFFARGGRSLPLGFIF